MKLLRGLRAADTWAVSLLALWPVVFFWQIILGQKVFLGDDITSLFFPLRVELARALQEGHLPLWTTYLESGFPIFAEGHIAALDPFNLILHLFLPVYLAFSYSILLRLALTSAGMYLFCQSAGLRVSSALIAGFVFGFAGFTIAHIQHLTLQAVAAWLPWLLFFQNQMQRARREGDHRWTLWLFLATITIALQFVGGFPQIALINLIAYGLISIVGVGFWNRPEDAGMRTTLGAIAESLGITALSVGLGMSIAAMQLIPTDELLNLSVRAQDMGMDFFTSYSMRPEVLTQFITPFWQLGKPDVFDMEYWAYLGVMPIFLAAFALLRRDARTWFFLILAAGALILTLGKFLAVYDLLYYVPVFNRLRVPARFLLLFTFAVSFLAAIGFDELQNRFCTSSKANRWFVWISSVFAILLIGIVFGQDQLPVEFWLGVWSWLPGVLVLFAAGTILIVLRRVNRALFVTMVFGLTIADLVIFAQPFASTLNPMGAPSELYQAPRPITAMDSNNALYRMFTTIYNESLRPNRPLVNGKQSAQIYSPLGLQKNEDYLFIMSPAMLNLLNVRYYTKISYPTLQDDALWGYSFALNLFHEAAEIPPTRAAQIEWVSYADKIANVPNGFVAGEITLTASDGTSKVVPIRVGIDTADWAYEGLASTTGVAQSKPADTISFPAYLPSVGHSFDGLKFVSRQTLTIPLDVTSVSARSNLPDSQLTIERLSLIDETGRAVSLSELTNKDELDLEFKSHAVALFENRDVMPRAIIVHQAEVTDDYATLAQMRQWDFRPDQVVFLNAGQSLSQASDAIGATDKVTITEYQSERVAIKASTSKLGYLVLADSFYPGWEAFVDGQRTPIYRADYAFRAVMLKPGEHTIIFEFHPFSVTLGAIVSGLSLVLCFGLTIFAYRRLGGRAGADWQNLN
ncbi:MAG: YfhO family protein [Chloroflexi bacterium]|nr:YfhO family protein [Chloroflexota bacterium]